MSNPILQWITQTNQFDTDLDDGVAYVNMM